MAATSPAGQGCVVQDAILWAPRQVFAQMDGPLHPVRLHRQYAV